MKYRKYIVERIIVEEWSTDEEIQELIKEEYQLDGIPIMEK